MKLHLQALVTVKTREILLSICRIVTRQKSIFKSVDEALGAAVRRLVECFDEEPLAVRVLRNIKPLFAILENASMKKLI